jgi:DNA polymerase III delta subunit
MSAQEPLKPAYAIWGEDRATVGRALAKLIARVARDGGLPPDRMRAEETPGDDVVAACETLSFGGLRLVVVEDADAWKAADAAAVVAYLERPNAGSCLALVATTALTPKLMAAVAEAGGVLHYGPDPKEKGAKRAAWFAEHLVKEVSRAGGSIPAGVARRAVDRVMVDRPDARRGGVIAMELSREAEKLAAYADGQPITAEMVEALVPRHPDAKTYELSDALVAGDAARAYDLLQDLATGDDPVAPILVQVQLANHFRNLATAQSLGDGVSPEAVTEATGATGYPARKLAEQARAMPPGAARLAVARLAEVELDLRVSALSELGRSRDDGERLVLETAARDLLGLARGGRPGPGGEG